MNPFTRQRGVGLIEVLLAILVTALGLLGLAALQGKAQRAELESYQRSQALLLLQDMASRLRANPIEQDSYVTTKADCSKTSTRAGIDLCEWSQSLAGVKERLDSRAVGAMIGGEGCIAKVTDNGFAVFEITVAWQGLAELARTNGNACGAASIPNPGLRRTLTVPLRFLAVTPPP